MKKHLVLLLLPVIAIFSCTKNLNDNSHPVDAISLNGAIVTRQGNFVFSSAKNVGGVAKIYLQQNGKYVVGLEQLNFKSEMDADVLFANTSDGAAPVKLFSTKMMSSSKYYLLPAGINAVNFKFIILKNDVNPGIIASAELK